VFNASSFTFLIIGIIASLVLIILCAQQYLKTKKKFYPKRIITAYECRMYVRLKEAFPQYHVLAQVAFSALITSHNLKIRNQFNRKVTDFVLLNESLQVLVIIELDDPSHLYKVEEDKFRDHMLHEAGYRVLRYTEIPSVRQLHKDIY
jgi:very-short-patch-repair endonuclease